MAQRKAPGAVDQHRKHGHSVVISSGVVPFKPFRDRSVDSKTVDCPVCVAKIGQRCIKNGSVSTTVHPSRRRLAIRLLNEEL